MYNHVFINSNKKSAKIKMYKSHPDIILPFYIHSNRYISENITKNISESSFDANMTFYGINPMIRPIPIGTHLYKITQTNQKITNVTDIKDMFNLENDGLYFIAYNLVVPNTIPLYFYKKEKEKENEILCTLDGELLKDENIEILLVIYVFRSPNVLFNCVNGTCIPWSKNSSDIVDIDSNNKAQSLNKCILYCNKLSNTYSKGKPLNILQILESEKDDKKYIILYIFFLINIVLFSIYTYIKIFKR